MLLAELVWLFRIKTDLLLLEILGNILDMAGTVWKKSQEMVCRFSIRERIIFLLTVTVAMLAGWYHFVWMPFFLSLAHVENRLASMVRNHQATKDVADLDHEWLQRVGQLVPAEAMTTMADLLMDSKSGLRLVGMQVKPAHLLLHCEQGLGHYGSGSLFRHDLELSLEGDYPSILNYVYAIESTPWIIKTDTFEVKVVNPPQATVLLQLHFFGLSRSLFAD